MGAGASAENARMTVSNVLMNKPEDASDITDLEKAKAEIMQLRRMAKRFYEQLGKRKLMVKCDLTGLLFIFMYLDANLDGFRRG